MGVYRTIQSLFHNVAERPDAKFCGGGRNQICSIKSPNICDHGHDHRRGQSH